MDTSALPERMRLDKWLWAARFFRTRSLAIAAINGGKVHLNGQRAKPGKEIQVGSQLRIHKESLEWDVVVQGLAAQRRPAPEAALLYAESAASRQLRLEQIEARRRPGGNLGIPPPSKPNKRDRRLLRRFTEPSD